MNQIVLITGASSGIGEATAYKFAANKYDIIITGRRKEKLNVLAEKLHNDFGVEVKPLVFDVRNKSEVQSQLSTLTDKWSHIDILINNAGLSLGLNPISDGDNSDWETMIDTNIKGLLYVSEIIMKQMIADGKGHIINLGSIAGQYTYANNNIYCATKFAVDSLTQTMRIDLLKYNIRVTLVNPGAVETEFSIVRFKGNQKAASDTYVGFQPLVGNDVADVVYYCANLPAHVNINEVTIVPSAQANPYYLNKNL